MDPLILILALLAALVWYWWDGLSAREAGVAAAARTCAADGVQFLDDSVVLRRVRFDRDDHGRLRLRRTYGFEYSDTGDNRRTGQVELLGREVVDVYAGPRVISLDPSA